MGLKSILRWKAPEPAVALYHWSEACCWGEYGENWRGDRKGRTYMAFEHGDEIYAGHEQIIAHVILASYCCS
jgi:hypothetical protein